MAIEEAKLCYLETDFNALTTTTAPWRDISGPPAHNQEKITVCKKLIRSKGFESQL